MTVWYNSYTNKFLSDRAHEEYFNNLVKSYDIEDNFDGFLEENYSPTELFNFTEADRQKARQQFENWTREEAKRNDVHDPFEVELASDEMEE